MRSKEIHVLSDRKNHKDNHENTKDCLPWRYVPGSAADLAYVPGLGQGKHEIKQHSDFRVFVLSCFRDNFFWLRLVRVRYLGFERSEIRIPKSKIVR